MKSTYLQELKEARRWVHYMTDKCENVGTLDLVGKLITFEMYEGKKDQGDQKGGGSGIVGRFNCTGKVAK